MAFSRNRGRPKKIQIAGKDRGTAELIEKRKANLTIEPLDLCAQKGLINEQQHNAGIRLRWLYTLKFGAPTISSYSPEKLGGQSCKSEDIGWAQRRQEEYKLIIQQLDKGKTRKIVMDICVFSRTPLFLYKIPTKINPDNLGSYRELNLFISGLEEMVKIGEKGRKVNKR